MTATTTLALIDKWGRDRNIIGGATSEAQLKKLLSELGELADGLAHKDIDEIKDGVGDVVVVLAMIAGIEGTTIAECVDHAYNEIKDRQGILFDGVFVKSTDPTYDDAVRQVEEQREREAKGWNAAEKS